LETALRGFKIFISVKLFLRGEQNGRKQDPVLSVGKGTVTVIRLREQNRYGAFSFYVPPQPIYGFRKIIGIFISTLE
jgi:hypothetical protein